MNSQKDKAFSRSIPEFLTVPEVSRFLRVGTPTVYRWVSEGKLPAYKIGGLKFRLDEILKFAEESRKPTPPTPTF